MSVRAVEVFYTSEKGGKWRRWPEWAAVPSMDTLKQLLRENQATREVHDGTSHAVIIPAEDGKEEMFANNPRKASYVIFSGIVFHAFKIGGKEWDCLNGWRSQLIKERQRKERKDNAAV